MNIRSRVESSCDVAALAVPLVALTRSAVVRCARCGVEIGPAAMLERVQALLGNRGVSMMAAFPLCSSCRLRDAGQVPCPNEDWSQVDQVPHARRRAPPVAVV